MTGVEAEIPENGGKSQNNVISTRSEDSHEISAPGGQCQNLIEDVVVDKQMVLPIEAMDPMRMHPLPPWVRGTYAVHSNFFLRCNKGINTISGLMRCSQCLWKFTLKYVIRSEILDIQVKVLEDLKGTRMVPRDWIWPLGGEGVQCPNCYKRKVAFPVIQQPVNWMFLLLGDWLGFVDISYLIAFVKANDCAIPLESDTEVEHRKLLYKTYWLLWNQLSSPLMYSE